MAAAVAAAIAEVGAAGIAIAAATGVATAATAVPAGFAATLGLADAVGSTGGKGTGVDDTTG
jgi:hypothetical protein